MSKINKLTIASAEAMAVELDDRGEKFAAQTIASLLAIIEDLAPKTAPPKEYMFGIDVAALSPGSRIKHGGRSGTVRMVDTQLPDPATGYPVILVDWDEP